MDLFEELERMAGNVTTAKPARPTEEDISRWRSLFNYTRMEAVMLITSQRSDVTRDRISDSHWELVRAEREEAGFDREAYEHSLTLKDVLQNQSTTIHDKEGNKWFIFRLGGMLSDAEKVKEIAGLEELPKVTEGENELGTVEFCWLAEGGKKKVEEWMEQRRVL